MTVFILIIIGMVQGQPKALPAGTFQTAAECQKQWQLLGMAAYVNHKQLSGVCLSYELPGKES